MNGTPLTANGTAMNGAARIDWKLPVFLVVLNLIAIGVQWGAMAAKLEELSRRQEQQDHHMEFIDTELKENGEEAGEVKEFRREVDRRFDSLDRQLDAARKR
jgi:hypothetical protein